MQLNIQTPKRYATQAKYKQKCGIRVSTKLSSFLKQGNPRSVIKRRATMANQTEFAIQKSTENQNKLIAITEMKRKKFVVSRRKKYKHSSTSPQKISMFSEVRNPWIEDIEYQSYQGLREYNEDRVIIKQSIIVNKQLLDLFAIFDGHGGSSVSQYCKLNFVKTFTEYCAIYDVKQALQKSLEQIQSRILQCGIKLGSGTCATILILKQNDYFTANIGDSRILIVKQRQQYAQLTQDHKPQNPNQKIRIQKLGGKIYRNVLIDQKTGQKSYGPFRVYPSRLSVSRTLGDYLIKKNQNQKVISSQAQFTSGKIEYGDTILLMSDGAYEKFSNSEISILFSSCNKETLKQRLNNFIFASKKRNTNDNVSMIAIQIKQSKLQSKQISTNNSQSSQQKLDNLCIRN